MVITAEDPKARYFKVLSPFGEEISGVTWVDTRQQVCIRVSERERETELRKIGCVCLKTRGRYSAPQTLFPGPAAREKLSSFRN